MKQSKQSTIYLTIKLMDRCGTCKDVTIQRVVKPYSHDYHYVMYKGQVVLVKQYTGKSGWYGTTVNW